MGDGKQSKKQYLFLGFPANPTGGPNPGLGSGLIFNPDMFTPLLRFFGIGNKERESMEGEESDRTGAG